MYNTVRHWKKRRLGLDVVSLGLIDAYPDLKTSNATGISPDTPPPASCASKPAANARPNTSRSLQTRRVAGIADKARAGAAPATAPGNTPSPAPRASSRRSSSRCASLPLSLLILRLALALFPSAFLLGSATLRQQLLLNRVGLDVLQILGGALPVGVQDEALAMFSLG